jgi:hypothetical protein
MVEYPVQVQDDFIKKLGGVSLLSALAELVWNSLDADSKNVEVRCVTGHLNSIESIQVWDDGSGMPHERCEQFFARLGGSWKKTADRTPARRMLHGQEGKGRFRALAIGSTVKWNSRYERDGAVYQYDITLDSESPKVIRVGEETLSEPGVASGVTVDIKNLRRTARAIFKEEARQELTETFAQYLTHYTETNIVIGGIRLNPAEVIVERTNLAPIPDVMYDGRSYRVEVELIEWSVSSRRSVYACNSHGFPLSIIEKTINIPSSSFSVYVKSTLFEDLLDAGTLDIVALIPEVSGVFDTVRSTVVGFYRDRSAAMAREIVQQWKKEKLYPYEGEPESTVEQIERQVFDIVAVQVSHYLPTIAADKRSQTLHLSLLRRALERSPEDLAAILESVLLLTKEQRSDFAVLLKDVSLPNLISAASIISDRLKFLRVLDSVVHQKASRQTLKERTQLHQMVKQECWLFGEEYSLSVDDQSLTELLRRHLKSIGSNIVVDAPVSHPTQKQGILDLVLSKSIKRHSSDRHEHLVVELKRPSVVISEKEVAQVRKYSLAIRSDSRFKEGSPKWVFWLVGNSYDDLVRDSFVESETYHGAVAIKDDHVILVRTWGEIIEDAKSRMKFFSDNLNFEAQTAPSLQHVRTKYAQFLNGVVFEKDS